MSVMEQEDQQPALRDHFRTPSSWETVSGGQVRSEGVMPGGDQEGRGRGLGMRTQGRMPEDQWDGARRVERGEKQPGGLNPPDELEREVGAAMMDHLMEQNRDLQRQVSQLQRQVQARSRERTPPPRPPPPPAPTTPTARRSASRSRQPRYTPQGTQVPLSPEPILQYAEVPEFPMWTRVEHHGETSGATMRSHGAMQDQWKTRETSPPAPSDERTRRLEREVRSLQATLERMAGEKKSSQYWAHPVTKTETPDWMGAGSSTEVKEESLRSVPITIPALVSPDAPNAALEAGDWLAQLRPLVGDVAASATQWWDNLMSVTNSAYHTWLSLGPLERLHVQAPMVEETSARQTRLDQRVTMMLMNSLPTEIKNELIATRQLHTAGVVFKVLRTYQPGGLNEKAATLAALTGTRTAESAIEGASLLRLWRRQALRARELGVTLPDPTLQVRALDTVMAKLLQEDPQATFRVQAFRLREEVDVKPNQVIVDKLFEMLQAECDQMLHNRVKSMTIPEEKPLVKVFSSPQKPGDGASMCRWWGTENGCRAGKSCPYAHGALEDKSARCWTCSSKHHLKSECPTRSLPGDQMLAASGGSDGGDGKAKGKGKGKTKSKGKKGKNSEEQLSGKAQPSTASSTQATAAVPQAETKGEDRYQKPGIMKTEASQDSGPSETASLVNEVTSLLRSLRVNGPEPEVQLRACHLMKFEVGRNEMTLIDGGATHCLRQAHSPDEWSRAEKVRVMVASGEVELRQNPETGTIITPHPVQGIIPVSKLVEEGYSIRWDRNFCRVEHPGHGRLEVMCQGCPMVTKDIGEKLMQEIEQAQNRRVKIRAVLQCGISAETGYEKQIAELVSLFPEVPLRLLERVIGEATWDPEQLPFNRRMRRKLQQADKIVVDMFAGPDKSKWSALEAKGIAVLSVDMVHGANVHDPHLSGFIQSVIETGKVIGWVSGPPCRTVSACRLKEDGGPPRLRDREGDGRFGIEGLKSGQLEKTDGDSVLWLKNLYWMILAQRWNQGVRFLLEQPEDPARWLPETREGPPAPSFLCWPETSQVIAQLNLQRIRVDQGALGHRTRKPTALITNMPGIIRLDGLRSHEAGEAWPEELDERLAWSGQLAAWAPGLVRRIAADLSAVEVAERRAQIQPQFKALTAREKKELKGWQAHYEQDHIPFRKDCVTCLETAGRDRMRKKVKCPQSYCLSMDIAGPFNPGKDQLVRGARYMMIGVVTVPVCKDTPLVEGLRELGIRVQPEADPEDEEHQGEEAVPGEPAEEDPMAVEAEDPGALDVEEAAAMDAAEAKWRAFLGRERDAGEVKVRSLTFRVPLRSRHATEVIAATAQIYARTRALCIPVQRLHTDRAREFASAPFRSWVLQRDLYHTMTAGDEPSGNSRVEREIGIIKSQVRTLIRSSKAPAEYWPMAVRQAVEQRARTQLLAMGIQVPPLMAFGSTLVAKKKTWFNRTEKWKQPMERVTCWGPAADMSMTSRGYYVCNGEGRWYRSTVLVQPAPIPDNLAEVQQMVADRLAEDEVQGPGEPDRSGTPRRRIWGKQPDPRCMPQAEVEERQGETIGLPTHDLPRRRVHGKQAIPASGSMDLEDEERPVLVVRPSLQALREGGECQVPNNWCGGSSPVTWARPHEQIQDPTHHHGDEQRWIMLQLLQHREMTRMVQDETTRMLEGSTTSWDAVCQAKAELENLEHQLRDGDGLELQDPLEEADTKPRGMVRCQALRTEASAGDPGQNQEGEKTEVPEVLQTRTVPIDEVRRDLHTWIEPFKKEVENLTSGPVARLSAEEFRQLKERQTDMQVIPMKMVATRKPTKLKGRIVACGNLAEDYAHDDISAGGACAIAVRTAIHVAANKGWDLGSIDVTGAFLQAPRRGNGRLTICEPPRLLQHMGLTSLGEMWKVDCALYGFAESPSDWGRYRDECLKTVAWEDDDGKYTLEATAEKHVWRVMRDDKECRGIICVYVDDILAGATRKVLEKLFQTLKQTWVCSPEEYVTKEKTMKFCGYDIRAREDGGYEVSQEGYLRDVLERRGVQGIERTPAPKIKEGDDEPWDKGALREAQSITGEVQWMANRTRPDISYATGLMARILHRRPRYVVELGNHLLRYLRATVNYKLTYKPWHVWQQEDTAGIRRDLGTLEIFSDASYAPPHEQYRSVQGLLVEHGRNPLLWSSSRQAFIVQSTAEAELLAYNESYQAGESTGALLEVFGYSTQKQLFGDNKAALVLCTGETGPWRTRHLRLRAAKLREAIQESGTWSASHLRGDLLVADGLTKSLLGQAFEKFAEQLHVIEVDRGNQKRIQDPIGDDDGWRPAEVKRVALKKSVIAGVLAATSAALVASGQQGLGGLIGLCALAVWRGQNQNQEPRRNDQKATRKGGDAIQTAQDGKPSRGGATGFKKADEKQGAGSQKTVQDGVPLGSEATLNQKTEGSSMSRLPPALRAFRVRVDVRHEPSPEPESSADAADSGRRGSASRGEAAAGSWRTSTSSRGAAEGEMPTHHRDDGPPPGVAAGGPVADGNGPSEPTSPWSEVSPGATYGQGDRHPDEFIAGPWTKPEFESPWTGRDRWFLGLWSEGWLVRVHAQERQRRFIAGASKLPCEASQLEGERITLRLLPDGAVYVVSDELDRYYQERETWKGFTFLKLAGSEFMQQVIPPRGYRSGVGRTG